MDTDLKEMYRTLGYDLDRTAAAAVAPAEPREAQERLPSTRPPAPELPPLDRDGIAKLAELFEHDAERVVGELRKLWDQALTEPQVSAAITHARATLSYPAQGMDAFRAMEALNRAAHTLPANFTFDGMDLERYPIDPGNTQFEPVADALRWITMAGPFVVHSLLAKLAPFRRHDDPKYRSRFVYKLPEPSASAPLDVALFSDFGTGLYPARYIAKQLRTQAYPYAIHLGDVYYAGRESEFVKNFKRDLSPILDATSVFTLAGNHERFSLLTAFFNYIDERRALAPAVQEQEGSYFCLRSSRFQIVAIDTEYYGSFRYKNPELLGWAEAMLDEGRRSGCTNILLSSDEPYAYGSTGTTDLLGDLSRIAVDRQLVDLWFWGNTHYGALFDAGEGLPFLGSCIGHGGFPYEIEKPGKPAPSKVLFLETQARFPSWTGLRQDRGNNGYCVLRLKADGSVELRYLDWMSRERCVATLARSAPVGPLSVQSLVMY